jgi:hypothetical protein
MALAERFEETGYWPLFRNDDAENSFPSLDEAKYLLKQTPSGNWRELFATAFADRMDSFRQFIEDLPADCDIETFISLVDQSGAMSFSGEAASKAPWPTLPPEKPLALHTLRPKHKVKLFLVKLAHPFEAPAFLGFGGWNDAPMPELQVAMLREWERDYGAVPIAINADIMECYVSQGTQSVRDLALEIWRSPHWFFWWD